MPAERIRDEAAGQHLVDSSGTTDVAVIGIPHPDFGEEVKAVVQPLDWKEVGPELEQELIACCRARLSAVKCPRSVDFDPALPRMENGELHKKQVRARYWTKKAGTLV